MKEQEINYSRKATLDYEGTCASVWDALWRRTIPAMRDESDSFMGNPMM